MALEFIEQFHALKIRLFTQGTRQGIAIVFEFGLLFILIFSFRLRSFCLVLKHGEGGNAGNLSLG